MDIIQFALSIFLAITASMFDDSNPDIDGNLVVWQSHRPSTGWDIYGYNLDTGVKFVVSNTPDDEYSPRISGNSVVWIAQHDRQCQVWYKNLVTDDLRLIVSHVFPSIYSLDIDGEYIAWGSRSINLYNAQTRSATVVSWSATVYRDYPRLDMPWLVFRQSGNPPIITGYNLSTTEIVTLAVSNGVPVLGGDVLVYRVNGTAPRMEGLHISSGKTFTVSLDPWSVNGKTDGKYITWQSEGNIHLYNIATGEDAIIDDDGQSPVVKNGFVVWQHWTNNWDIWAVSAMAILPTWRIWLPVKIEL